jgi:hypothetical protein
MRFLFIILISGLGLQLNGKKVKAGAYGKINCKGIGVRYHDLRLYNDSIFYRDDGSCAGSQYRKGKYNIAGDTLIARVTHENRSGNYGGKFEPVSGYTIKYLIRSDTLIYMKRLSKTMRINSDTLVLYKKKEKRK